MLPGLLCPGVFQPEPPSLLEVMACVCTLWNQPGRLIPLVCGLSFSPARIDRGNRSDLVAFDRGIVLFTLGSCRSFSEETRAELFDLCGNSDCSHSAVVSVLAREAIRVFLFPHPNGRAGIWSATGVVAKIGMALSGARLVDPDWSVRFYLPAAFQRRSARESLVCGHRLYHWPHR